MVDPAAAWQMFLDGQLDSAEVPPGAAVDAVPADQVHVQPGGAVEFYGFSASQPPFEKPLVRQAFAAATDRAALAQATGRDPEAALTLTPPGIFGHVDGAASDAGIDYDPGQARQWLADAGYPGGEGLPEITLWVPPFPSHMAVAEAVRREWHATLGVSVTLAAEPPVPELNTGRYQIWRYAWAMEYADAHNFLGDALGVVRGAFGAWNSDTVDALLGMARAEPDASARGWLYLQTEKALVENDAVVLPLYYHAAQVATRPHLTRTYPAGGYFDIATWRLVWTSFLPVVSVGPG